MALTRPSLGYQTRIFDRELVELLDGGAEAVLIEGAKALGKTTTATQQAKNVHELDERGQRAVIAADPERLLEGPYPTLIDEWQRVPDSWDLVRRAVDDPSSDGVFILTGSASPARLGADGDESGEAAPTHSGALRIISTRMRPMSLAERAVESPSVSLSELLSGERPALKGRTDVRLENYVDEILLSGFPALRLHDLSERVRRTQLDGYIERIVDHDFEEMGHVVRNPAALRRWMTAYAAASSTTASHEKIRDAAVGGRGEKPARSTTKPYRDVLERLWVIDPVAGWLPTRNPLAGLSAGPKHQLVDPALAARLLGVRKAALLKGESAGPAIRRDGSLLGCLFESLVTIDVRVYAQAAEAEPVSHLRTHRGDHEIDLIVPRGDGRVLAIEVKLASVPTDRDAQHLRWLADEIGDDLIDAIIITTGRDAYRRGDGIGVVPAALLGP